MKKRKVSAPEDNVKTIHRIGSKQGHPDLHDVIMRANKYVHFDFEYDEAKRLWSERSSQFLPQSKHVSGILSAALTPDYHRPSDQPAKINFTKIASAARLIYMSIYFAAEHGPFPLPAPEATKAQ